MFGVFLYPNVCFLSEFLSKLHIDFFMKSLEDFGTSIKNMQLHFKYDGITKIFILFLTIRAWTTEVIWAVLVFLLGLSSYVITL